VNCFIQLIISLVQENIHLKAAKLGKIIYCCKWYII